MERLKFRVDYSFWIFIMVAVVLKQGYFAAMYSIAMVLHEIAHYVVAKSCFTVAMKFASVFSAPFCTATFKTLRVRTE